MISNTTTPAIRTIGLGHQFSSGTPTLHEVNLEVPRGEIYGFLGPNGSGKTTTLSLLLGLYKLQQGKIEIFGQSLASNRMEVLKKLGSLIESPSLYGHLTARENLEIYRAIYEMPRERTREVLAIAGLEETGSKKVKNFSLGMKQRLAIAQALLPRPQLLILDEPTNGLDPNGIIDLRELLRTLNQTHEVTILISSHILAEVEKIVSHVGILSKGKMVFQGTREQLMKMTSAKLVIRTSNDDKALSLLEVYKPEKQNGTLSVPIVDDYRAGHINRLLVDHNIQVFSIGTQETNLEQLFIQLTTAS